MKLKKEYKGDRKLEKEREKREETIIAQKHGSSTMTYNEEL